MSSTFKFVLFSIFTFLFSSSNVLSMVFSFYVCFLDTTTSPNLSLDKLKVLSLYNRYGFLLRSLMVLYVSHIPKVIKLIPITTFNERNNTMGVNNLKIIYTFKVGIYNDP